MNADNAPSVRVEPAFSYIPQSPVPDLSRGSSEWKQLRRALDEVPQKMLASMMYPEDPVIYLWPGMMRPRVVCVMRHGESRTEWTEEDFLRELDQARAYATPIAGLLGRQAQLKGVQAMPLVYVTKGYDRPVWMQQTLENGWQNHTLALRDLPDMRELMELLQPEQAQG